MSEQIAALIWMSLAGYLGIGFIIATFTVFFALGKLELGAASMPVRVRALILPGLTALWPLIVLRLAGLRAKEDRR